MPDKTREYIPVLRYRILTPLFDPCLKYLMREEEFKGALLEESGLRPGLHVLDFGCGTGTLAAMMKRKIPEAEVRGVDIDGKVLALARKKIAGEGLNVALDLYDAPCRMGTEVSIASSAAWFFTISRALKNKPPCVRSIGSCGGTERYTLGILADREVRRCVPSQCSCGYSNRSGKTLTG